MRFFAGFKTKRYPLPGGAFKSTGYLLVLQYTMGLSKLGVKLQMRSFYDIYIMEREHVLLMKTTIHCI